MNQNRRTEVLECNHPQRQWYPGYGLGFGGLPASRTAQDLDDLGAFLRAQGILSPQTINNFNGKGEYKATKGLLLTGLRC
jgi:hypothetical protein